VLDFGAGIGTFSNLLQEELNPVCLEVDTAQANILIKSGFEVIKQLPKEEFDFIYSLNVLEHIKEDQKAVADLARALRPGGRLLVFVPAFNFLFSDLDKKVGHYRRYTKRTLLELFIGKELKVLKLSYFDAVGFFFAILFKAFRFKTDKINKRTVGIFDKYFFPLNLFLDKVFSNLFGKNVYIVLEKK
jgi:SAM-dependent methyltransferase